MIQVFASPASFIRVPAAKLSADCVQPWSMTTRGHRLPSVSARNIELVGSASRCVAELSGEILGHPIGSSRPGHGLVNGLRSGLAEKPGDAAEKRRRDGLR